MMRRIDVLPPSLALSQAALESAWGSSRFAQKGNNLFGQWCFEEGCGMVPTDRTEGKSHEVAAFKTVNQSIEAYLYNLNQHFSYHTLKSIREELRRSNEPITGTVLAEGLDNYSELGDKYVAKVKRMIRLNNLAIYDKDHVFYGSQHFLP